MYTLTYVRIVRTYVSVYMHCKVYYFVLQLGRTTVTSNNMCIAYAHISFCCLSAMNAANTHLLNLTTYVSVSCGSCTATNKVLVCPSASFTNLDSHFVPGMLQRCQSVASSATKLHRRPWHERVSKREALDVCHTHSLHAWNFWFLLFCTCVRAVTVCRHTRVE